jgi:hypothetical protein
MRFFIYDFDKAVNWRLVFMIKLFFLLPVFMCTVWWWYLNDRGYTIKEGVRGFTYILSFNAVIVAFFVMMLFIAD